LIATGVAAMLGVYILFNIGMTAGLTGGGLLLPPF
jgi:cell division protein FtsW (lipid II flippase)